MMGITILKMPIIVFIRFSSILNTSYFDIYYFCYNKYINLGIPKKFRLYKKKQNNNQHIYTTQSKKNKNKRRLNENNKTLIKYYTYSSQQQHNPYHLQNTF